MSVKKFKFVSPGVFINEIDNSQLPATPVDVGPVVIGRFPRGPAMVPGESGCGGSTRTHGNPTQHRRAKRAEQ